MGFNRYYHDASKRRVVHVSGFASRKTYRKKYAGCDVIADITEFSAAKGERSTSHSRSFDARDGEEKAVAFYLMRAPMTAGATEITKAEFVRLKAQYLAEFSAPEHDKQDEDEE